MRACGIPHTRERPPSADLLVRRGGLAKDHGECDSDRGRCDPKRLLSKRRERKVQYAALPFRPGRDGVEILLITSRETKRWVIPKGWPMKGKAPHEAAAVEAHEEAGLDGRMSDRPVGRFRYDKRLRTGKDRTVEVEVYALRVEAMSGDWPEKEQRRREWFPPAVAAALVDEPELKALIVAFGRVPLDALADGGLNGSA